MDMNMDGRGRFGWFGVRRSLGLAMVVVGAGLGGCSRDEPGDEEFGTIVHPFIQAYCVSCHSTEDPKGRLDLSGIGTDVRVGEDRPLWKKVGRLVASERMPPADAPQPAAEEIGNVLRVLGERLGEDFPTAGVVDGDGEEEGREPGVAVSPEVSGGLGLEGQGAGGVAVAGIRPVLDRFCVACHGKDLPMAGIHLEGGEVLIEGVEFWERVALAVEAGKMPPVRAEQPSDEQRNELVARIRSALGENGQ